MLVLVVGFGYSWDLGFHIWGLQDELSQVSICKWHCVEFGTNNRWDLQRAGSEIKHVRSLKA